VKVDYIVDGGLYEENLTFFQKVSRLFKGDAGKEIKERIGHLYST
jgi:hypothetical protein